MKRWHWLALPYAVAVALAFVAERLAVAGVTLWLALGGPVVLLGVIGVLCLVRAFPGSDTE